MQPPSSRGAGEPAGQGQQGAAQGLGDGLLLADAQAEDGGPAQQVVGQAGARLEVTDGQLADGVAAVVGVQPDGGADAVGEEPVVAPGREQLLLVDEVADPTDHQPVAPVGSLGDLPDPARRVGDVDPVVLRDAAMAARMVLVWRTVIE